MNTTWIIISVIGALILIFIYNGFRTRCPNCGDYSLHPKDNEGEAKQQEYYETLKESRLGDKFDQIAPELDIGTSANKPGYTTAHFKCKSCGHTFTRKTALTWLTIANKLGEEVAIREYRKVKSEPIIEV